MKLLLVYLVRFSQIISGTTTLEGIGTGGAPAADSLASEITRKFRGTNV